MSPLFFDSFKKNDKEQYIQSPIHLGLLTSIDADAVPDKKNIENVSEQNRKRKRNENMWKKNVSKKLRNEGKSYVSATRKIVPERNIKNSCSEKCKLQCSTKFTETERKSIFNSYWSLGNISKQWNFISNSMEEIRPKYRYVRESCRKARQYNNAFYFKLRGEKIRVCKLFFKNTLGITDRPICTVMKKQNKVAGTLAADDNRGKHNNHRKVDEVIRKTIREHIESLPKVSHHFGANFTKDCIDGRRSIADIHKDYVEICKSKNIPYGNYTLFYRILTKEYNISLCQPKKDRCKKAKKS